MPIVSFFICTHGEYMTKGVGADWRENTYIFPLIGINFKSINDKVALLYIFFLLNILFEIKCYFKLIRNFLNYSEKRLGSICINEMIF